MPNRPAKGAAPSGRLHNIFQNLIGGMINSASSNVGVNPTYSANPDSSTQGPDEGTGEGTKTQNKTPYVATGLFGKREAQERNLANYQNQLNTGMDVEADKKKKENELPIRLQLEEQLKQIGLNALVKELAIKHKDTVDLGNSSMLQGAGIPDLPGNLEDYQTNITPNKINALQTGGIKTTAENILGTDQANLKDTALNNTKANFLRQAQAEAQGGEDTAMENLQTIPLQAAATREGLISQPKATAAKIAADSTFNVGPQGAVNLLSGAVTSPQLTPSGQLSELKAGMMKNALGNMLGNTNVNPANPSVPKNYRQINPSDVIVIGGKQYIKD